jgi:thiaminase/transcriptional activator TenA
MDPNATPFTEQAWAATSDLRRAIHALPFNCELATGTLSAERFRHYVLQDSLYLRRYSRVLALCAAKAPHEDAVATFADSAHGAIQVEQSMHAGFLEQFGVDAEDLEAAEMTPACRAYTDFLVASCYEGSFGVAVAAVLPCFWIYLDVGLAIDREAAADNPYRPWIDTYADDAFAAAVEKVKSLADEAAAAASPQERAAMLEAFRLSTEYEFLFWDSAWHQRTWPQHAAER